ncbi:DUF1206 domain-containing protein [Roseobacter sp. CCS2]|uniref:DUF1206 domain-containing protein n=1 Tax=Roseobacter sp. CCS2 TaxID=391593 RepID=UPI0000F3E602|nr:DUF1206 domain-containing protein [Roseobacter sp. CCS2]EBA11019.1 hypothetical protein RCCS2_01019 [Roseobacter sp. CCS2]
MSNSRLDWAVPVMRAGYAGRGVTYTTIAALSLWTIWQGGSAQGTSEALKTIETTPFGSLLLCIIGLGLLFYMLWRLLDSIADLEDEGRDATGLIARIGMAVTGLLHGVIGAAALFLAFGSSRQDGGESHIVSITQTVMSVPFGVFVVGLAGLATIGAGLYYLHKAWSQSYREKLVANHFTTHWNAALRFGVAAQGVVVTIIGIFLSYAAWTAEPAEAGGLGQTFSWLSQQVYGQIFVTLLCVGLLSFALFLFVNAAYRVVPRLADPGIKTVAQKLS